MDRGGRPGAIRTAARRLLKLAAGGALLAGVLSVGSLLSPREQALALPSPIDWFDEALSSAAEGVATGAMKEILEALFGGLQAKVTTELIAWVASVPDITGGNVDELRAATTAIAFGALAVVATLSVLRYWLAGMGGGGSGFEGVEAFSRVIAAVFAVLAWPYVFEQIVALLNAMSHALITHDAVEDDLANLFRAGLGFSLVLGPVGWFFSILVVVGGTLLLLALLMMKVVLTASVAVLYIAMPVCLLLWPLPETAWLTRAAMRSFLVCTAIPFVWAIVFTTAAAISMNTIAFKGEAGAVTKTLIMPLTSLGLFFAAIIIPKKLVSLALLGGSMGGGGFVSRTISHAAGQQFSRGIQQHLPAAVGGSKGLAGQPQASTQFQTSTDQDGKVSMTRTDSLRVPHVKRGGGDHGPSKDGQAASQAAITAMTGAGAMARPTTGAAAGAQAGAGAGGAKASHAAAGAQARDARRNAAYHQGVGLRTQPAGNPYGLQHVAAAREAREAAAQRHATEGAASQAAIGAALSQFTAAQGQAIEERFAAAGAEHGRREMAAASVDAGYTEPQREAFATLATVDDVSDISSARQDAGSASASGDRPRQQPVTPGSEVVVARGSAPAAAGGAGVPAGRGAPVVPGVPESPPSASDRSGSTGSPSAGATQAPPSSGAGTAGTRPQPPTPGREGGATPPPRPALEPGDGSATPPRPDQPGS